MPLHDWTGRPGWSGVHHLWITELLYWIKPRLPAGYRAYIGSTPTPTVSAPPSEAAATIAPEPDEEIVVPALELSKAIYVQRQSELVAAVELVSQHNQDRDVTWSIYLARYVGYLLQGVHLLLVDVHRRPLGCSFADEIARQLEMAQPSLPAPFAAGYRVGDLAAPEGRFLAVWRRPLTIRTALPVMPLPLTMEMSVPVDLEHTYMRAAAAAYLS